MSRKFRSIFIFLLIFSFLLYGCSKNEENVTTSDDILTMKKSEGNRTKITILVKYAFSINNFEEIIEERFPDIDIVQVGNYTANTTLAKEYEARMVNDDLTDIVMTWPYDVGEEYCEERLIDLSGLPFTSKYNISMLDSLAQEDGSLYYLPGPASIRGIVYNKTLFEEKGWNVPKNYPEFVNLCKEIEASGMRAFQLPLGNSEVLDTAFIGFNYGNAYSKPSDADWLEKYNEGEGNFLDHFSESLDTFQDLIDEGIIKASDLDYTYSDTQLNLFTRKTAMSEDSVQLTHSAKSVAGSDDEFAVMPLFTREPENDWARIYMVCYIGLNKHLQDSGNEEKYEKVLKLMDYISSEEGQTALAKDDGAMYSSLKNMEAPDVPEISDLRNALAQGRYGSFPTFKRSEDAFHEGLTGMLKGELNKNQAAAMIDQSNQSKSTTNKQKVLGKASEDFSLIETGNFVTDLLRKKTKSDFSLFLDNGKDGLYNGKGISAKFYKGKLTQEDIDRVFPDLKNEDTGELWKVTMKGSDIIKTLEYAIPVDNNITGWFYYFSGLKVSFDPLAQPGSRVKEVVTSSGKKIKKNKVYSLAVMENSVPEEYIIDCDKTGLLIQDLIKEEIVNKKTISPSKDKRFTIVNND